MLRFLFKLTLKYELINIIAFFYFLKTKKIFKNNSKKKINILALNHNRFIDVLRVINQNSDFQILALPFSWQSRFLLFFYGYADRKHIGLKSMNKEVQSKFYSFLKIFLNKYYKLAKINLVIGAAIHYKQDIDWGHVSKTIGIPYVVLHKENLYASEDHLKFIAKNLKERQRFQGSHVIVHNEIVKKTWVKNKFIGDKNISICGKLVKNSESSLAANSLFDVVFFSFGPGTGITKNINVFPERRQVGYHNLCKITHLEIINFAIKNPDKKVIIKPKWGGNWLNYIYNLAHKENIDLKRIENLVISEKFGSFDLIENSSVVIAFNSTTILEAALKNKFVIIPCFAEAEKKGFKETVFFRKYFNLFEIAESSKDLYEKISLGCKNPGKHKKFLQKRIRLYEQFVSPIKGNQIKKCIEILKKQIPKNAFR